MGNFYLLNYYISTKLIKPNTTPIAQPEMAQTVALIDFGREEYLV